MSALPASTNDLSGLGLENLERAILGTPELNGFSLTDTLLKAVRGDLGLSPPSLLKGIAAAFFAETGSVISVSRSLIIAAAIGALFTNLTSSFGEGKTGEIGFYATFMACAGLCVSAFAECLGILTNFASGISSLLEAAIPAAAAIAALSGSGSRAALTTPVMFALSGFTAEIVRNLVAPLLAGGAAISAAGGFAGKDGFKKLAGLVKTVLTWASVTAAGLFMGAAGLIGLTAPSVDGGVAKAAKWAVGAVPVVGGALSGSVDAALAWGGAIKGGFAAAAVIAVAMYAAAPVLKLAACALVYKAVGALLQPIADEKITDIIDGMGGFIGLMSGLCALIGVTFIFTILTALG